MKLLYTHKYCVMIWREIGLQKCQNNNDTLIVPISQFYCKYFHMSINLKPCLEYKYIL